MGDRVKVIAVFDIGKTNKKFFLWNELYQIVFERQQNFNEIPDEDGFLGDDLPAVRSWMLQTFAEINALPEYQICALNFSGYGATVVFVDEKGHAVSPLYNYLKAFPEGLFPYSNYGGDDEFARATASPILGNLNSGLQAFRVSQVGADVWSKTRWVMHWPNFLSSIFTGNFASEITSIGCHTALWDFDKKTYHDWVTDFGLRKKLPEIAPSNTSYLNEETNIPVGLGLHDSSSALVPYLRVMHSPFLLVLMAIFLISTDVKAQPEKAEAGIKAIMQDMPVMGLSVAVVKDNKIIYTQSFGTKSRENNAPLTNDCIFRIASISKSFSSTNFLNNCFTVNGLILDNLIQ